ALIPAVVAHRRRRGRDGAELCSPRGILPEGDVGARQRGSQSPPRWNCLRPADGDWARHYPVAPLRGHLPRRGAPSGYGRTPVVGDGGARLVCGGGRAETKGAADHSFVATGQGCCVDLVSDFSQRTCVAFRLVPRVNREP